GRLVGFENGVLHEGRPGREALPERRRWQRRDGTAERRCVLGVCGGSGPDLLPARFIRRLCRNPAVPPRNRQRLARRPNRQAANGWTQRLAGWKVADLLGTSRPR